MLYAILYNETEVAEVQPYTGSCIGIIGRFIIATLADASDYFTRKGIDATLIENYGR